MLLGTTVMTLKVYTFRPKNDICCDVTVKKKETPRVDNLVYITGLSHWFISLVYLTGVSHWIISLSLTETRK